ncbi:MAG: hypothetical protein ACLFTY_01525 [Candidatus Aenigmatarchaeota archaeon]
MFFCCIVLLPNVSAESEVEVSTGRFVPIEDEAIIYGEVNGTELENKSIEVFFRWGEGFENVEKETSKKSLPEDKEFFESLENLKPDTIYTYQAVAQWNGNESSGSVDHFRTEDFVDHKVNAETRDAEEISYTEATLIGEVNKMDFEEGEFLFRWGEKGNLSQETKREDFSETGTFEHGISDLQANTSYQFQAAVDINGSYETGENRTFTTLTPYPEISDLSPEDGASDMAPTVNLSFDLSLPLKGEAEVKFYDGEGSIIAERSEAEEGRVSAVWKGLNFTEEYEWNVEVKYRNRTVKSEKLTFETMNQTRIQNIENRIYEVEGTISETDALLENVDGDTDTSALEAGLSDLRSLHTEAEKAADEGNYGLAEEKITNAEEVEEEVRKEAEKLKEQTREISNLWIVLVIIIVATVAIVALFVFTFQKGSGSSTGSPFEDIEEPDSILDEDNKDEKK